MTIQVFPEPSSTSTGLPYGVTATVFDGASTTGTYTYTTAVPAGNYAFSSVSLDGNTYGAEAYSATLAQTVKVLDGQTEYFQTTASASDWTFTAQGLYPNSTATPVVTTMAPSGNGIDSIAKGSTKWIAGISNGAVSLSSDGYAWSEKLVGQTGTNTFVSYGNSRYWFANGTSTSGVRVGASTDGVTWTTSNLDNYSSTNIYSKFVNDRFFYVGNRGFVAYSTDGNAWTRLSGNLPKTDVQYALTYVNGKFISGGAAGGVYHSTTGASWDRYVGPTTNTVMALRYLNGLYISAGQAGTLQTSTDAMTWTARTSSFGTTNINALTYGNGVYVAAGDNGQLRTSTDAITWTSRTSNFGTSIIYSLAYGAGVYVAGGAGGFMTYSTDGTTWTSTTSGFGTSIINAVEFVNGIFVAGGAGGRVSSSTDGITWTGVNSGAAAITSIAYGNGRYIVGSTNQATSYQSTDLVTWTVWALSGGYPNNSISTLRGIAYNGSGTFIAVGTNGDIIGSTDGITWNRNYPSVFNEVTTNSINHDGTNYVVLFDAGSAVAKSTDLVTWTYSTPTITGINYTAYGNGTWVGVVPSSNNYHTSTDAITWSTATLDGNFARYDNVQFIDGYFWRSGAAPTTSYPVFARSTDGVTWFIVNWNYTEAAGSRCAVGRFNLGWFFVASKPYAQYTTSSPTATSPNYILGTDRDAIQSITATSSNLIVGTVNYSWYSDSLTPTSWSNVAHTGTVNKIVYGDNTVIYCLTSGTNYSINNGASTASAYASSSNYAAYSSAQDMWVLAVNVAGVNNTLAYSTTGTTFNAGEISGFNVNGTSASTTAKAFSVAAADGFFLAGFDEGMAAWSGNGRYWVPAKPVAASSITFNGAAIGNGKGVLAGNNGTIMVADAGIHNWKFAASPFTFADAIKDVAFTNGTFLAASENGRIATSSDGITWTVRAVTGTGVGFTTPWLDVSVYGDNFFVSGTYGVYKTTNTNSPTAFRLFQVSVDTLA